MGQKVNPISFRLPVNSWKTLWYADKNYSDMLHQDLSVKAMVRQYFKRAGVSSVDIERVSGKLKVIVGIAMPGMAIGRGGADIEKLRVALVKLVGTDVLINISEEKRPETNAVLVADGVAKQLEKRVSFRKATKRAIQSAMRMGAKGIKVMVSGRLGGAEIARSECYKEGRVPLHTVRASIGYANAEANTTYGVIGVKVWVYKGDKLVKDNKF